VKTIVLSMTQFSLHQIISWGMVDSWSWRKLLRGCQWVYNQVMSWAIRTSFLELAGDLFNSYTRSEGGRTADQSAQSLPQLATTSFLANLQAQIRNGLRNHFNMFTLQLLSLNRNLWPSAIDFNSSNSLRNIESGQESRLVHNIRGLPVNIA